MGAFEPGKFFNLVFLCLVVKKLNWLLVSWAKRSVSSTRAGTGLGLIIFKYFINILNEGGGEARLWTFF